MRERNRKTAGGRNQVPALQLQDTAEIPPKSCKKGKSRSRSGKIGSENAGNSDNGAKSAKYARAYLEFAFESSGRAEAVRAALAPEENASKSDTCAVTIKRKKNVLCLEVEARHTTALRAVLNSFVRWIMVVDEITKKGGK